MMNDDNVPIKYHYDSNPQQSLWMLLTSFSYSCNSQYNRMDRDIPAFNQLVVNKINQKNLHLHEQRLQNIRSSQNSRAYLSTSMNGRQNRKAQQLEEDKKTEIERHNLMLFNKMKRIMNRNDPHNRPLQQTAKNGNRTSMELNKIQQENRNMFDRIERQRPTISNKKLYEERQKHLNVLKFLGKYSAHSIQNTTVQNIRSSNASTRTQNAFPGDRKKAYTVKPGHYLEDTEGQMNPNMQENQRYDHTDFQNGDIDDDLMRMKAIIEGKRQRKAAELSDKRRGQEEDEDEDEAEERYARQVSQKQVRQRKKMEERPIVPRSAKDITLYKTTREINSNLYQIRILRKHITYEISCNSSTLAEEPLRLQFNEDEGNRLLEESNYDYAAIISRLRISKGRLLLSGGDEAVGEVERKEQGRQEDLLQQNRNKRKNQFPLLNSHISQQNEEDSYQVEGVERRARKEDLEEVDSLGEEEQFEKYTAEELSESQDNLNFMLRPANFEQKLQQIKENSLHTREEQLDPPAKYEIQLPNQSQVPPSEQEQEQGNYQEALDQQVY